MDQKFGVKKSILFFLIWYSMALIINCTDTLVGIYISVLMLGVAIGAAGNFIMSLPTSVFGRHGFEVVNMVLVGITNVTKHNKDYAKGEQLKQGMK